MGDHELRTFSKLYSLMAEKNIGSMKKYRKRESMDLKQASDHKKWPYKPFKGNGLFSNKKRLMLINK